MEILGALPNLMLFSLGWNSYIGEILVFRTGAFPNLKKLFIFRSSLHDCLREVNFEDGTSPRMEMIEISNALLKSGIIGINRLPRLKEISLGYGGKVANLAVLQGEVDEHPNSPMLRLKGSFSHHDPGYAFQGSKDV
jgi:disease resistance protein RPM1